MASFRNIPIFQVTSPGIKDIHEYMHLKYLFVPITDSVMKNIAYDLQFLQHLSPTTDMSEENLMAAKEHLQNIFEKNKHLLDSDDY